MKTQRQHHRALTELTCALAFGLALAPAMSSVLYADDNETGKGKMNLGTFQMHLQGVLTKEMLKDLSQGDNARFSELLKWKGQPLELRSDVPHGKFRARFEQDFLVLWLHRDANLKDTPPELLAVCQEATSNVLTQPYRVGGANTVVVGEHTRATRGSEIRMYRGPQKILGAEAIVCSYRRATRHQSWPLVSHVYLLVHHNDVVIALEKIIPRTYEEYVYEGLEAAKAKRATNVIFPKGDPKDLGPELLNACMWASEDDPNRGDLGPPKEKFNANEDEEH